MEWIWILLGTIACLFVQFSDNIAVVVIACIVEIICYGIGLYKLFKENFE